MRGLKFPGSEEFAPPPPAKKGDNQPNYNQRRQPHETLLHAFTHHHNPSAERGHRIRGHKPTRRRQDRDGRARDQLRCQIGLHLHPQWSVVHPERSIGAHEGQK